jgi:glycosyltransferase involved in cell wall biosynthesis
MNVLFLTNFLQVGGIETNLVLLTHELARRGHNVTVASRGGTLVPQLCDPIRHVSLHIAPRPREFHGDVSTLRRLLRWAGSEGSGVVHVLSASTSALLAVARLCSTCAWGSSRPLFVASVMGLQTDPDEPEYVTRLRTLATNVGADRVIVTSPAIEKTIDALPIRASKKVVMSVVGVRVVATDEARRDRSAVRQELGVNESDRIVLTIGQLHPRKSHGLFIRAAAHICKRRGDVRFFIVGDGEERERLAAQISQLGLSQRLTLLGERLDVHRLLSATDIYVRPGVAEGFAGITVLEAQTLGVPVVAFFTQDVTLAIEHGVTGWLVPPKDTEALGDAVLALLEDPQVARRLGDAGRRHVERSFALEHVVDRLEALYESGR